MTLKKLLFGCFAAALSFNSNSQVYIHDWAIASGSSSNDAGKAIVAGSDGSIYHAGTFSGTINFNPWGGGGVLTSAGQTDVYLVKYDPNGSLVWAKSFGDDGIETVVAMDIDAEDNLYLTGQYESIVDFNPHSSIVENLTAEGAPNSNGAIGDSYVCKFNDSGSLTWVKNISGDHFSFTTDVTVDRLFNVHLSGTFTHHLKMDPNAASWTSGTYITSAAGTGGYDGFGLTLNVYGAYVKHYHLSNALSDITIKSVFVDSSLNQYFTGDFNNAVDFNPGPAIYNLTAGFNKQTFITKLTVGGWFVWARKLMGSSGSSGIDIKVDGDGNIYTLGEFFGNIDLNPGSGVNTVTGPTTNSLYVSKLNRFGYYVWGKGIVGSSAGGATAGKVLPKAMALTENGKVFITGAYTNSVDFNPGMATTLRTSGGSLDGFVSVLKNNGAHEVTRTIESSASAFNNAVAIDKDENILTTGKLYTLTDFRPQGYPYYQVSMGGYDMFVHKFENSSLHQGTPQLPARLSEENGRIQMKVKAYPNPTLGVVTIELENDAPAVMTLMGLNGSVVMKVETTSIQTELPLGDLESGCYVLTIEQNGEIAREKIVKK